jgi:hypothetical protein
MPLAFAPRPAADSQLKAASLEHWLHWMARFSPACLGKNPRMDVASGPLRSNCGKNRENRLSLVLEMRADWPLIGPESTRPAVAHKH